VTRERTKSDLGKGLDQVKVSGDHWKIEGYDVYTFANWEGTHTSRGAVIEKDGQTVARESGISAARGWIREQTGKQRGRSR
jgi:hypothetical protein